MGPSLQHGEVQHGPEGDHVPRWPQGEMKRSDFYGGDSVVSKHPIFFLVNSSEMF